MEKKVRFIFPATTTSTQNRQQPNFNEVPQQYPMPTGKLEMPSMMSSSTANKHMDFIPNMEPDSGSSHAHPNIPKLIQSPARTTNSLLRPFRLCDVDVAQRILWCDQAVLQLGSLKNRSYHLRNAYECVQTPEEEQMLITNIISVNDEGKSTLAAILEAFVGLERSVWSVHMREEMQHELERIMRFDTHCQARVMALDIQIDMKNQAALEAQRVAMCENTLWKAASSSGTPIWVKTENSKTAKENKNTKIAATNDEAPKLQAATWAKTKNSGTAKENTKIAATNDEAPKLQTAEMKTNTPKKVSSSNDQPSDAERTNVLTQSEEQTTSEGTNKIEDEKEEQQQRPGPATKPRFGSLTLAEAQNFSVWRVKLSL